MILRRVIDHFRKQEWTAIFLDFVIVVVGVFVGIQVSNWNAARADEAAYNDAMRRLAEESRATLDDAASVRAVIDAMLADVRPAVEVLRNCETGADAEAIVNQGLNAIRSSLGLTAATLAVDQLVSDERLLDRQSGEERARLRRFHADLHSRNDTGELLVVKYGDSISIDNHPLVDFTGVVDPGETFNKVDIRRARVGAPLDVACKDLSFLKLFYQWERSHVFQLSLVDALTTTITENARALGLEKYQPLEGK